MSIGSEAIAIVEDLNKKIFGIGSIDYYNPFQYRIFGVGEMAVYFMGVLIWSENDDKRVYKLDSNEIEPLYDFLIRESEKVLNDLKIKMDFILNN